VERDTKETPVCVQNGPYGVGHQAGQYFWRACGLSTKQPFCDGSHNGTSFKPVEIALDHAQAIWLCGCKRTANAPHCDGQHQQPG
jgi:CDGSH iron-sulfur domain-containing protein 3